MSKKFEQLLEYVVNNETEKAQALFHDIVVGKSREIYENLIAAEAYDEEADESIGGDQVEGLLDEISADESTIGEEDESMGGEEHPDMGGEEHSDMGDTDANAHDAGDMEARVLDLEQALEQLRADLADQSTDLAHDEEDAESDDEESDDEEEYDDEESGDEEDDEESDDDEELYEEDEEDDEEEDLDEDVILEYTENVGKPYGGGKVAGTSEDSGVNKTSPVNTKKRSQSIEGSPVQIKDGGQGNHGVRAPGKLTSATTKPDMKKVPGADMKKV